MMLEKFRDQAYFKKHDGTDVIYPKDEFGNELTTHEMVHDEVQRGKDEVRCVVLCKRVVPPFSFTQFKRMLHTRKNKIAQVKKLMKKASGLNDKEQKIGVTDIVSVMRKLDSGCRPTFTTVREHCVGGSCYSASPIATLNVLPLPERNRTNDLGG